MSIVTKGKLKFRQGAAKPAYIPKKARKGDDKDKEQQQDIVVQDQIINYEPYPGSGTITTSGRTIHGNDTNFREEVENGDTIIIENPVFKTREQRTVTLILSSKSILLEQPFLQEYSTFVSYQIKKKAKVIVGENITKNYKERVQDETKTKGIKKAEMSVRIKKGLSYEDKKVEVEANLSREQLLNLRQKLIKDKHCW